MDVKGIIEKVVAGLVGAALLAAIGWIAGRFSSSELPSIRAEYVWLDLPNPIFPLRDQAKMAEIDRPFNLTGLGAFLGQTGLNVKVGKLTIRNTSRVRSKQIELTAKAGGFLALDPSIKGQELRKQATVNALDGEASAQFLVFTDDFYRTPTFKVIYDDKLVDVIQMVPDQFQPYLYDYVLPIVALIFIGALTVMILLFAIGVWLYSFYDPDVYIRALTPAQVKVMIEKLDAVRARFPDKLPKPEIPASS